MAIFKSVYPITVTGVINPAIYTGEKSYTTGAYVAGISGPSDGQTLATTTVESGTVTSMVTLEGLLQFATASGNTSQHRHGGGIPKTGVGAAVYQVMKMIAAAWHQGADQNSWEAYAGSIAGLWVLCGHNTGKSPGQKIFTQVNWYRLTRGIEISLDPSELGPPADAIGYSMTMSYGESGPPPEATADAAGASGNTAIVIQEGRGTANQVWEFAPGTNVYGSADPQYDVVTQNLIKMFGAEYNSARSIQYNVCSWGIDGAPGPKSLFQLDVIP